MPFGGRPLDGEQDCRLFLPLGAGSIDDDRTPGTPGLPLVAEGGRSESEVRKFGGTSWEKPGMSNGFHGLGFTVGELARGGAEFLIVVEAALVTAEDGDLTGGADTFDAAERVGGLRVGVVALDVGLVTGAAGLVGVEDRAVDLDVGVEDLAVEDIIVGVEDLAVDLDVGVEDLAVDLDVGVEDLAGAVGLAEGTVDLVGVEDREGLDAMVADGLDAVIDEGLEAEAKVGRPVGVAGLDPRPPEEEGLRTPALDVFNPGAKTDCLDARLFLAVGSSSEFAS